MDNFVLVETFVDNAEPSLVMVGTREECKKRGRKILRDNGYYESARHLVDDFNRNGAMVEDDYALHILPLPGALKSG
jgi:hypothetical protein